MPLEKNAPIVAVDMGGTHIRIGLVDVTGRVLDRVIGPSRPVEGPERVADRIRETAERLLKKGGYRQPVGVGAAIAGPIDADGVIYDPPHLTGWRNVPFRSILQKRFRVPVAMGNDANVACLGEHAFGAGKGIEDLIYMTVSTGVGGGVLTGGRLVTGWKGLGAEVGHIIIDLNGPTGACGHRGCLESHVSGTSIAMRARESLAAGQRSALHDMVRSDLDATRAEDVFEAAAAGDPFCADLVRRVGAEMGAGIAGLVHIFNPKLFVLGGGVSNNWDMLAAEAWRTLRERAFPEFLQDFDIVVSRYGDDIGLMGAAALVLQAGDASVRTS